MDDPVQPKRATILVVDDMPENIDVLRGVLKPRYTVKVAINGEQALKQCRSDQPPDLVLMDVMMPGMDGFEVCRRLKGEARTEGIPVIFVTAMNEACDEVRGFDAGGVDYINKPVTPAIVLSRVNTHLQLRSAYRFMRDTFGRYLSDEIVDQLMDAPEGLKLGGETRHLTIMMADLRGFTSLSERLPAETVVEMINVFLGRMTEVIQHYQGTIDEFIGDAILAIFGAPVQREDDALRAVRCAVEMQLAMQDVNCRFDELGYPAIEMGIGINTGEAIVGNIGSEKRTKYGVVGRVVNTASRIESYTIGGQILVADATRSECQNLLRIDGHMTVTPKGLIEPITIYDIGGVSAGANGEAGVELPLPDSDHVEALGRPIHVQITALSGKHQGNMFAGEIVGVGQRDLAMMAVQPCSDYSNLKITMIDTDGCRMASDIYAKVIRQLAVEPPGFQVHPTSLSPDAEALLAGMAGQGGINQRLAGQETPGQGVDRVDSDAVHLLHLSDFHLFGDTESLIKGICSHDSLAAVLAHARLHLPDPAAIILGGDLAQDESATAYRRLATMLDRWQAPFMVTPGNHASLPTMRDVLFPALASISGYADCLDTGSPDIAGWRVIALNSHEQGSIGGMLASEELVRLEQLLAERSDCHVLIAVHHHPVPIGSRWMDRIGLKNRHDLWAVVDRHPQVRAMICGHIHQAFDAMRGDVRVLGTPSTCVQFVPQQDRFRLDNQSPGYRWLELLADGTVRTGIERIEGFIPADLNNDEPY